MVRILGISAYYHDSAAALIEDGRIVAAAQEERFTRIKHDADFPRNAARYCLREAGIAVSGLDAVIYYDKPFVKFERLLETYLATAPRGLRSFVAAVPVWIKEKLFVKSLLRRELRLLDATAGPLPELLFSEHHLSHAASAFYPSPFSHAAILCLDGVGEWATTSAWLGDGPKITALWEQHFPHSLGLLYSAFTAYTGFKVNSGEYKMMGLAPYGEPRYVAAIRERLIDIKDDGTFRIDMQYFDYATGLRMTSRAFDELFGGPPRRPDEPIDQRTMDLAASVQAVTNEVVLRLARTLRRETGARFLCMAGGVALNCVTNGLLAREDVFDDIWIQPAAGDAGGALGAALLAWHECFQGSRRGSDAPPVTAAAARSDAMQGAFLGPAINDREVCEWLAAANIPFVRLERADLLETIAERLADGAVIGWVQGRMEFGPRALGNRSILGDPRSAAMQRTLNLKIKFRESFRPFAPSVLADRCDDWFDTARPSPYMLLVSRVRSFRPSPIAGDTPSGFERLKVVSSVIPAVTHVDGSARVQTVERATNPLYYDLIAAFERRTGVPLLVNTSFNVRGEPIVCTPTDAYRCFMGTAMDYLVIGQCLLDRSEQNPMHPLAASRREFIAD